MSAEPRVTAVRSGRPPRRIRVAIVDDQPLFASGLAMLIEAQADMDCVGMATTGLEAIALAETERPDVILMDLRMPQMNGLIATERILAAPHAAGSRSNSLPQVIVLTTIHKNEAVLQALQVGASAFLTKDVTPDVLLAAIRTAHFGDAVVAQSLDVVRAFADSNGSLAELPGDTVAADPLGVLSPRESEVFSLVAAGMSNSEISESLFLSDATVKSHVRAILTKLDLKSRIQVVIFAYENFLLAP